MISHSEDAAYQEHPLEVQGQGRNLFRNLVAGGASSLLRALLQLGMLPIMGHLLGPAEFGLYAMALPIFAFFTIIGDGGLGASLGKERSTDPLVWTTAFYVMLAVGIVLVGAVNLSGFALAALMHEPRLIGLMSILSLSFLFIALATLPSARLIQRNDLVSLSAIDTLAAFVGSGVAIVVAYRGYGALSLAIQSVTTFGIRACGLNVLAFEVPGRRMSLAALKGHLNTGGVLVGTRLVDMICRLAENVVFAKSFGPAALGSYTFANQICRFLCESASNPVWGASYAQIVNLNERSVAGLLYKMARLVLFATFPIACLVAVSAPSVIPLMLGTKWMDAAPFLQILICSYAFSAAASVGSAAFLATGENKLFLYTSGALSVARVLAVALGPWIGTIGAVVAVAIAQISYVAVMALAAERIYKLDRTKLMASITSPVVAGTAGAFNCFLVLHALPSSSASTIGGLVFGGVTFIVTLIIIDDSFRLQSAKHFIGRLRERRFC